MRMHHALTTIPNHNGAAAIGLLAWRAQPGRRGHALLAGAMARQGRR